MYILEIGGKNKSFIARNLTINGTNYVSETQVDTSSWPKVFKLTVTDENNNIVESYDYAKLIQQAQYAWDNNKWYLAFAPVSYQELMNTELKAQLEYLAMMTDIDLEN